MNVLVTAGPTREPIDPVRYLTNRSSGKMGYALASAFAARGHHVLLVSGPTILEVPEAVDFLRIETAAEMHAAVEQSISGQQIVVCAAAVADYRPAMVAAQKIKKHDESLILELVRTVDILGSIRQPMGFTGKLIGFAAETERLEEHAREKLLRKGCDLIIANDVSQPGIGFDANENKVLLVYRDHSVSLPQSSKSQLAEELANIILNI